GPRGGRLLSPPPRWGDSGRRRRVRGGGGRVQVKRECFRAGGARPALFSSCRAAGGGRHCVYVSVREREAPSPVPAPPPGPPAAPFVAGAAKGRAAPRFSPRGRAPSAPAPRVPPGTGSVAPSPVSDAGAGEGAGTAGLKKKKKSNKKMSIFQLLYKYFQDTIKQTQMYRVWLWCFTLHLLMCAAPHPAAYPHWRCKARFDVVGRFVQMRLWRWFVHSRSLREEQVVKERAWENDMIWRGRRINEEDVWHFRYLGNKQAQSGMDHQKLSDDCKQLRLNSPFPSLSAKPYSVGRLNRDDPGSVSPEQKDVRHGWMQKDRCNQWS
ncbi:uncharacterized protein, partial [Chamaea fasciata]|uniref:uncharacterized protein n=1 Tax=Chamaea fasciata TaxID=190680 RepID=UPI00336AB2F9